MEVVLKVSAVQMRHAHIPESLVVVIIPQHSFLGPTPKSKVVHYCLRRLRRGEASFFYIAEEELLSYVEPLL